MRIYVYPNIPLLANSKVMSLSLSGYFKLRGHKVQKGRTNYAVYTVCDGNGVGVGDDKPRNWR